MLDEVDEHRLGPLEIIDHNDLGTFSRASLEEPPGDGVAVSGGDVPMTNSGIDPDRDQDLDERPVRDPLAVREAPSAQDVALIADALQEVRNEPRLPRCRPARGA